jgi:multisubunit Na+/H+ antiporter MnhB subunit
LTLRNLFTITLVFSACFVALALALTHEFAVGHLSPRGLGGGLAGLCVAAFVVVVMLFQSRRLRDSARLPECGEEDQQARSGLLWIWVARLAIIILVLLLVHGVLHIGQKPVAPRVIGVGANLVVIYGVIVAMRRMGRGPRG